MIITARIHRLPQVVADAIAAGEVVERPASVVKELLENAIDAGAAHVDVALDGGGLVRIEVVDDGHGIAAEDMDLAVERHATSKIENTTDLTRVRTLGFRGEALASIAAVSNLSIVSRPPANVAGTALRVRTGEVVECVPAAAPPGTRVEVCELFASTPARLRFLRSTSAEGAAAVRVAADLALTHPEVAITCRSEGRQVLRSPGDSLRGALRAVFGPRAAADLVDVDVPGDISITGAISGAHAHRAARTGLVLVVNGRRVQHRALQLAVDEAYRGLIPAGRHPFGVACLDVDPAAVDVNVHPAKREVRFSDERAVFAALQRACWSTLRSSTTYSAAAAAPHRTESAPGSSSVLTLAEAPSRLADAFPQVADASRRLDDLTPLRALGQVDNEWVVASAPGAVVLVDPHAAHEKVLYQELRERWASPHPKQTQTQLLLIPVLLEGDRGREERVERHAEFIASCGFGVDIFGPGVIRCTAVPATSSGVDPERLLAELIDTLDEEPTGDARYHRVAALVACHSAVRFGDRLEPDAQQQLLDRLLRTAGGMTCPHGRPTVIVLDDAYLRRSFHRPPR